MPAIDIDREAAYEAAQRELAKPVYPRASLSDRIAEWVNDLMFRLMQAGAGLPGGWFTIVVLGMLLTAAVIVAVRIARRTMEGAKLANTASTTPGPTGPIGHPPQPKYAIQKPRSPVAFAASMTSGAKYVTACSGSMACQNVRAVAAWSVTRAPGQVVRLVGGRSDQSAPRPVCPVEVTVTNRSEDRDGMP